MSRIGYVKDTKILSIAEEKKAKKQKEVKELRKIVEEQAKVIKQLSDRITVLEISRNSKPIDQWGPLQPQPQTQPLQPGVGGGYWLNGVWYPYHQYGQFSTTGDSYTYTTGNLTLSGMTVDTSLSGSVTNGSSYVGYDLTGTQQVLNSL